MDHLLFCVNHPQKVAKRHCNKCNKDLCNECVFDSHIEHHSEITKLKYSIDTKKNNFSEVLSKEIKSIIDKSLNDLKPQIYKLILEKTEQYIKEHKNLELKVNLPKNNNMNKAAASKPLGNISERAKQFLTQNPNETQKKNNNPPISKGIKNMAKMFEPK